MHNGPAVVALLFPSVLYPPFGCQPYPPPLLFFPDFAPLYQFSAVMGIESQPDLTSTTPTGLCNAVILSQPYSPFIVSKRRKLFGSAPLFPPGSTLLMTPLTYRLVPLLFRRCIAHISTTSHVGSTRTLTLIDRSGQHTRSHGRGI